MPGRSNFITRQLNQTAVYWGTPVADGWGGRSFASGIEIAVRWEHKAQAFVDALGQETVSRAVVYADQDFDIGGYLYLGELADLSSAPDPKDSSSAYEIRQFEKTPDLGGTRFIRRALL